MWQPNGRQPCRCEAVHEALFGIPHQFWVNPARVHQVTPPKCLDWLPVRRRFLLLYLNLTLTLTLTSVKLCLNLTLTLTLTSVKLYLNITLTLTQNSVKLYLSLKVTSGQSQWGLGGL